MHKISSAIIPIGCNQADMGSLIIWCISLTSVINKSIYYICKYTHSILYKEQPIIGTRVESTKSKVPYKTFLIKHAACATLQAAHDVSSPLTIVLSALPAPWKYSNLSELKKRGIMWKANLLCSNSLSFCSNEIHLKMCENNYLSASKILLPKYKFWQRKKYVHCAGC